jgi:hypothetical protein
MAEGLAAKGACQPDRRNLQAGFLPHLADYCLLWRFARFDRAGRQAPDVTVSLRKLEEDVSVSIVDQSGDAGAKDQIGAYFFPQLFVVFLHRHRLEVLPLNKSIHNRT